MSATKAMRDAQARVAELEAEQATIQRQVDEAETLIKPLAAKVGAIRKRRAKTAIISNTAGTIWFGTLASIGPDTHGVRALAPDVKAKAISEALLSGGLKLTGSGGHGVTITLRGLSGRVRVPDKAAVTVHKRAVLARQRADTKAAAARRAEQLALEECFHTAVKVPTDAILPDLIAEVVASVRLAKAPQPYQLRHDLQRMTYAESPLATAKAHLAFVKTGSTEPCPCRTCASDRQQAILRRDEAIRLDALPTVMGICPAAEHGKHRIAIERTAVRLSDENRERLIVVAPAIGPLLPKNVGYYGVATGDAPKGWCRKGPVPNGFVRVAVWLAELEKAAKVAAKAAKKVAKPRIVTPTATGDPDTLNWICPSCSEESDFDIQPADFEAEESDAYVECSSCGYEGNPDTVKTVAKAA